MGGGLLGDHQNLGRLGQADAGQGQTFRRLGPPFGPRPPPRQRNGDQGQHQDDGHHRPAQKPGDVGRIAGHVDDRAFAAAVGAAAFQHLPVPGEEIPVATGGGKGEQDQGQECRRAVNGNGAEAPQQDQGQNEYGRRGQFGGDGKPGDHAEGHGIAVTPCVQRPGPQRQDDDHEKGQHGEDQQRLGLGMEPMLQGQHGKERRRLQQEGRNK